jgi:hypothetical protein
MTITEQQLAVAKLHGWQKYTGAKQISFMWAPGHISETIPAWCKGQDEHGNPVCPALELPKYHEDLDAITDVVRDVIHTSYARELYLGYLGGDAWQREITKPAEKVEALLRTFGKWEEGPADPQKEEYDLIVKTHETMCEILQDCAIRHNLGKPGENLAVIVVKALDESIEQCQKRAENYEILKEDFNGISANLQACIKRHGLENKALGRRVSEFIVQEFDKIYDQAKSAINLKIAYEKMLKTLHACAARHGDIAIALQPIDELIVNYVDRLTEEHKKTMAALAIVQDSLDKANVYKKRLEWLHTGGEKDADGFEWGVFRVKWDKHGQVESAWHTNSDFSDLDKEMRKYRNTPKK